MFFFGWYTVYHIIYKWEKRTASKRSMLLFQVINQWTWSQSKSHHAIFIQFFLLCQHGKYANEKLFYENKIFPENWHVDSVSKTLFFHIFSHFYQRAYFSFLPRAYFSFLPRALCVFSQRDIKINNQMCCKWSMSMECYCKYNSLFAY